MKLGQDVLWERITSYLEILDTTTLKYSLLSHASCSLPVEYIVDAQTDLSIFFQVSAMTRAALRHEGSAARSADYHPERLLKVRFPSPMISVL